VTKNIHCIQIRGVVDNFGYMQDFGDPDKSVPGTGVLYIYIYICTSGSHSKHSKHVTVP
jgi:hypothetical protein